MTGIPNLEAISERIRSAFEVKNTARDQALARSRELIRYCAMSIRAVHRQEFDLAGQLLEQARQVADAMRADLASHPDLYYAGYTQDALKEFVEASATFALVQDQPLPEPEAMRVEYSTYLAGLAEAVGELRRHVVDRIRAGELARGDRLMEMMDDIYDVLVTMDYPDAITAGLRRLTDVARGIIERTRGDLMIAARQEKLEAALAAFEGHIHAMNRQEGVAGEG
ncbi:MAG: haloacid dehalogenase [Anaerolineae bacterium]|nr:haloacid dehalogenase [Anaerolineae bacterium]